MRLLFVAGQCMKNVNLFISLVSIYIAKGYSSVQVVSKDFLLTKEQQTKSETLPLQPQRRSPTRQEQFPA